MILDCTRLVERLDSDNPLESIMVTWFIERYSDDLVFLDPEEPIVESSLPLDPTNTQYVTGLSYSTLNTLLVILHYILC